MLESYKSRIRRKAIQSSADGIVGSTYYLCCSRTVSNKDGKSRRGGGATSMGIFEIILTSRKHKICRIQRRRLNMAQSYLSYALSPAMHFVQNLRSIVDYIRETARNNFKQLRANCNLRHIQRSIANYSPFKFKSQTTQTRSTRDRIAVNSLMTRIHRTTHPSIETAYKKDEQRLTVSKGKYLFRLQL